MLYPSMSVLQLDNTSVSYFVWQTMIVPEMALAGQGFQPDLQRNNRLYRETYDRDRGSGDYEDDISCVIL